MSLNNKTITSIAKELGFDLIGFAPAVELDDESEKLDEWLNRGFQAGMTYMERNRSKRKNVKEILPEAKSVISLGLNYFVNENHIEKNGSGKISRYAWGKDYHLIIWEKLDRLVESVREIYPSFEARTFVDTGPLMDKAWAVRAGLGWLGKHTNVISRDIGSWFFIATVLTNIEFDYGLPSADFCGSCTACIDACPTDALVDEYLLDSNKCISYLTIENKDSISREFKNKFSNWVFGCDICQEVCPWNDKFASQTKINEFMPSRGTSLDLNEILRMDNEEFRKIFKLSPLKRAKLSGLQRNAKFICDSCKDI